MFTLTQHGHSDLEWDGVILIMATDIMDGATLITDGVIHTMDGVIQDGVIHIMAIMETTLTTTEEEVQQHIMETEITHTIEATIPVEDMQQIETILLTEDIQQTEITLQIELTVIPTLEDLT